MNNYCGVMDYTIVSSLFSSFSGGALVLVVVLAIALFGTLFGSLGFGLPAG